ncbi:mitoferrin-1-like [Oratosquilla oratoria]|uniref:mitoferrin-1-like n=1 Tax=Oratosquilla oratoria TaxID=337810 RepID=UPI003F7632A9
MEFDDYESLPTGDVGVHMTAGAVAGVMEHCVMYPIDSVKTRMQSLAPSPETAYRSVRDGLFKMVSTEGITRPVWGVNAVIVGAGPAHALYFSAYEMIKKWGNKSNSLQTQLANAAAGCGATLLHDGVMVPADVIKQRMQMFNSPYRSCWDCLQKVYATEGLSAFYRSYSTQLVMNLPFHAIHITMYENLQHMLNPERNYNPKVHMVAGAMAGAVGAAFTTPLDVCKTLLNTQEQSTLSHLRQTHVVGILPALRTIYSLQGFKGFFRGVQARVLYQVPGTAISWSIYELFKYQMSLKRDDEGPNWDHELEQDKVLRNSNSVPSDVDSESSSDYRSSRIESLPFQGKWDTLNVATHKTVERLRHLQVPSSLTASCAAAAAEN